MERALKLLAIAFVLSCRPDATSPSSVFDGLWMMSSFQYVEAGDTATLADAWPGADRWSVALENGHYESEALLMFMRWPGVPDSIKRPDGTYAPPIVLVFGEPPCADGSDPSTCQPSIMTGLYATKGDSIEFGAKTGYDWPYSVMWHAQGDKLVLHISTTLWTVDVTFARSVHALALAYPAALRAIRDGTRAVARPRYVLDMQGQDRTRCWWSRAQRARPRPLDCARLARHSGQAYGLGHGAGVCSVRAT